MSTLNILFCCIIVILAGYCLLLKLRMKRTYDVEMSQQAQKLEVSNSDVMQYIRDTAESFKSAIENRKIDLNVKCTPESMMGWMDTDKIDKVLIILLSDMVKKARSDGKIRIDAYTNSSYDKITIRISDNGERITSIGYMMAHQLIRLHHGTIMYEHYDGQGNMVLIVLPIKKDAFPEKEMSKIQISTFHIPQNIELNIPTIELPSTERENNPQTLEAIIQQAYSSTDQQFLQRAIKCVNDHIMDSDYDREAFAADMGSSVSTLYNKIRALTGKNTTNFVRDIRIKAACQMAKENPELRVSDIAYQVGFKDPKYFATTFKRVMGVQPKEYMKGLQSLKN